MGTRRSAGGPLYEQTARRLQHLVVHGSLQPGDPLPSERELAEELSVSRNTLRGALHLLEQQGLVETMSDGHRIVRPAHPRVEGGAGLEAAALWDLQEAREVVELKVAELACLRATPDDLARLEQMLDSAQLALEEGDRVPAADRDFHLALAQATRNVVFYNITRFCLELQGKTRAISVRRPGRAEEMLGEHRAIVAAIKARDPAGAVAAMARHLQNIRAGVGAALAGKATPQRS